MASLAARPADLRRRSDNRRAIGLRPGYAEAHVNLGNALRAEGKLDEALASYRHALALARGPAHYNVANLLTELGKADEAVSRYRRAIELKPDYADAFNNLGTALDELGNSDARSHPTAALSRSIPSCKRLT